LIQVPRNLISYLTPTRNACFLKHCRPQFWNCKQNPACWSAWLYNFPKNGIRATNFSLKTDALIDTWMACGKLHWGTIVNNCITTHGTHVPVVPNPFVVPVGPRKPVFTATVHKFVKCVEVTMNPSQQAWGQVQCHKSLSVQEKNNVVFLCNSTQLKSFLHHCEPPNAFTAQIKKFVRCKPVTMPTYQLAWGKYVCQNRPLTTQEKHNVVFLCNPTQLANYISHCKVAPPLPVTTTSVISLPTVKPQPQPKPAPVPIIAVSTFGLSTIEVITTKVPGALPTTT